jgi:3'-5' exoribonuclease
MKKTDEESKTIREMVSGDRVTGFFVVRKKELKTKKDGSPYLLLALGDSTGRIPATLWNNVTPVHESVQMGDIVKVRGAVGTYNNALQFSVERIRKAELSDNIDKKAFIPRGDVNTESLIQHLTETLDSVKNPHLRRLLEGIFKESDWIDRFREAPGGKLWHHAYMGGLLEHTMAVVRVCETMAQLYPMADRDMLISGALLHDIGKLEEYGFDRGFIDYTDEGRLWGHISIGAQRVRAFIEDLEEKEPFPSELKKQIIHLILSHQGELEHGSPVLPQTLEAMILYYADEMDSKANALKHIIERDSEPDRKWSDYVNLLNRFIYLKDNTPPDADRSSPTD